MTVSSQLGEGVTRLRLPMVDSGTPFVNVYLFEGDDGYTLIDCGWATPDVFAALRDGLEEAGIPIDLIKTAVATHYHPDHAGNSGPIVRASGASLVMSAIDKPIYERETSDVPGEIRRRDAWLQANGLEPREGLEERAKWFDDRYDPAQVSREVHEGDVLQAGSHKLEVVLTPGHTPGHICLFDRERSMVLTGDHVLPEIVPHIGHWGISDDNPLGHYVESLRKVAGLGAKSALPGHFEPISDLNGRIDELIATIEKRQSRVLEAFIASKWQTAAEVARNMKWGKRGGFDDLEESAQSLALSAVVAQIAYLASEGHVERDGEANRYRIP